MTKNNESKAGARVYLGNGIFSRAKKDGTTQYGIMYTGPDGKRVREIIGPTLTLARKVLVSRKAEIAEGRYNFPTKKKTPTFLEFSADYLNHARQHKRSWRRDSGIVAKLVEFFGTKRLDQITTWDVQRYAAKSAETIKKATVNRETSIMRRMFNLAIEWEQIEKNPAAAKGIVFREPDRSIYPLSDAEQDALLLACPSHLFPIVAMALNTGLRKGELLALDWADVDLVRGALVVRQSKSGRVRHVPLNSAAVDALRRIEGPRQGRVFCFKGRPIADNINRSFGRARRNAGLERVVKDEHGRRQVWPRFHDLRHTFATSVVLGGTDLVTARDLLGHANVATTQRYSHPTPDSKRRAVDCLVRPNRAQQSDEVNEVSKDSISQVK